MDPGEVPAQISSLSDIEQQLISQVHSAMSVYKVKGQQLAYSDNVLTFRHKQLHRFLWFAVAQNCDLANCLI